MKTPPFKHLFRTSIIAALPFTILASAKAELVAWWDFNQPASTGIVVDQRGGQPAMVLGGAVITPDGQGKSGTLGDRAARFGVGNQRLQNIGTYFLSSFADNQASVSFWIKYTAASNCTAVSFVSSNGGGRAFQSHAPWGNGQAYFDTGGGTAGGTNRINGAMSVTPGTWHHIALVRGPAVGSTNKWIYKDGVQVASGTNTATIALALTQLLIGNGPPLVEAVNGDIDEFAVFSTALTPAQVTSLAGGALPSTLQTAVTDSDSDGLPDLWETFYFPGDLTKLGGAPADRDSDGLNDVDELARGTNPTVQDTDGDGLLDAVETGTGIWTSAADTGTFALIVDTDADGLLDGVETNTETFVSAANTGSNPHLKDTDGDRATDSREIAYKTNPSLASSKPYLLAWWDFNNSSNGNIATDLRAGNIANRAGTTSVYSADGLGVTGLAGDKAISSTGGTGGWNAPATDWLNVGTALDTLTVMFWQKNTTNPSASSFWMNSPTAPSVCGMQAHVPWSDGTIYYDHSGQTGTSQRIAGAAPGGHVWTNWHHYAFVKTGGEKRLYIDGVLSANFDQTSGAEAFKSDFSNLAIGFNGTTNGINGQMDDFAVYAAALDAATILSIADGTKTPAEVEDIDADGLPDSWEYQYFPADLTQLGNPGDRDSDGLEDVDEYAKKTNPNDDDTDDDGLLDGVEDGGGVWMTAAKTGTDPLKVDSDGDTLSDGIENNSDVYVSAANPGTDPNKFDSDTDGFSDSVEVSNGFDPNDILDFPVFSPDGKYLMAYWDFNDASNAAQAVDSVNNHVGVVTGTTYSAEGGGFTGTGTDRSMSFAGGTNVVAADGTFANLAAGGDKMTVTFWQKFNSATLAESSSFWINSVKGAGRGMQSHSPWSDGNIYFDHSGCCAGNNRLSGSINTNGAVDVTAWHHYTFVKDGSNKRVYLDGVLLLSGTGAAPIVDDFTTLRIGNGVNGINGYLDDFAIFAGALDQDDIARLAGGESPALILSPSSVYDTWVIGAGLTSGNDGINDDGETDGLVNLLEFAFGTDPKANDNNPLVVTDGSTFTPGTQIVQISAPFTPANVTAQFVRRIDAAAAGLTYIPEFSADLATWETDSSNSAPTVVSTQGDYQVVSVPYLVFLSNGQKASFFRIRVNSTQSENSNP